MPAAGGTNGAVAVWNICNVAGPMQIVDPDSGAQITTVGLQGRPSWSPDGRRIATVDHFDGMVKVADVAAGTIDVVADLGLGPYHVGDDCATFEKIGWSPDGTSLLLQYGGSYGADFVVRVVRLDGSADRTLFEQPQLPGVGSSLAARWLPDGQVMIADVASDTEGDLVVQRGDPWGSWPPPPTSIHRPDFPHVSAPSISPTGDRIALTVMGEIPAEGCSTAAACTGGIVIVEIADGSAHTISTHRPDGPSTFSPDGSQVAFVEYDYDLTYPAILVVSKVDGSGERIIEGMEAGDTASWSPDGRSVVVGGFAVRRADVDSGAVVELVPNPPERRCPRLRDRLGHQGKHGLNSMGATGVSTADCARPVYARIDLVRLAHQRSGTPIPCGATPTWTARCGQFRTGRRSAGRCCAVPEGHAACSSLTSPSVQLACVVRSRHVPPSQRCGAVAWCQAVPSRGSRMITGVSVDRRLAYASSRGSTATQCCHSRSRSCPAAGRARTGRGCWSVSRTMASGCASRLSHHEG